MTQHILHLLPLPNPDHPRLTPTSSPLIPTRVNQPPNRRTQRRRRNHNTPIRAKVFETPDDGDDDGREAENGTVACADGSGCEEEEVTSVLEQARGEEDLAG